MTASASPRLTLGTAFLLTMPPLLWSANSVIGRMINDQVPPVTLNLLRWLVALVLLLPLAHRMLHPDSPLWTHWRRYLFLGLLGVACYNTFQYLALRTTTPINVTLVASSAPVFMLAMGSLFYGQRVRRDQLIGAVMSIIGVMLVMCRGDWQLLAQVQFVEGDVFVLIATAAWAWYSWQISLPDRDPPEIRNHWANFLMAQVVMGLVWSSLFSAAEWTLTDAHIHWSWPVVAALLYIGIGPAILAYRCWGLGVQRVGPNIAGFFSNLTPVFAAVLSSLVLGEWPQWYHLVAFVLIVGGIVVSSQPQRPQTDTA